MQICGHVPGAIGRIVELHGRYYAREWRFGRYFEAKVASELGEFLARFDASRDGFWIAAEGEAWASGSCARRWTSAAARGTGMFS